MEYIAEKIPVVALDGSRKADKLVPVNVKTCSSRNREKCELFIVEGKSAAGSVIKARNAEYQAVLSLRGKPLNSAGMDILDILQNEEMKDLIATIGTGVDERFSLDKVQYGKIIITADADPDGANIASLVLGLFFSHMKYLIKAGMVYICDSPLYKQGDKYFYSDNLKDVDFNKPTQRFKGLGELNITDVKTTITNSDTRRLTRITEEDMRKALRLITDTYARKKLLMESGVINEDKLLKYNELREVS
jgi:DNA gyrase/topoisomerase IV subunit B